MIGLDGLGLTSSALGKRAQKTKRKIGEFVKRGSPHTLVYGTRGYTCSFKKQRSSVILALIDGRIVVPAFCATHTLPITSDCKRQLSKRRILADSSTGLVSQ